jgi:hypothetical protein
VAKVSVQGCWSLGLHARDLRLLNSIDELLDCLLEEVDLSHLHLLILTNPGLHGIQPCLVEFLWLNEHLHPLFLLPLQVLDDGLMINEMLLIFGEILSANILDFLQFLVILLINISIVRVYLFCGGDHIIFQFINLLILFSCKVISH